MNTLDVYYEKGVAKGMKQGMEQGIAQGVAQGMKQGIAQGVEEGKEQIVLRMLASRKFSTAGIAGLTGVPEMMVKKLKISLKRNDR